jgi:hypothetical protein
MATPLVRDRILQLVAEAIEQARREGVGLPLRGTLEFFLHP